jgi:3-dehydrotetronate 4-kinase
VTAGVARCDRVLGAIADDLTGAVELASVLIARGMATSFTIGAMEPVPGDTAAHVVALKSRVAPVAEAVAEVTAAAERLLGTGYRHLFFKYCATFDSTPAGNIGPCAEALLRRLDADFTAFCPTLCETGRSVFQGHMFGGDQLLSESPKRFDPLTPMTDANLVRVLQAQSRLRVGLIAHPVVHAGPAAVTERIAALRAGDIGFAIADAIYESDLATIAEATADLPLMTGNSSVAAYLPPAWRRRGILADEPTITCLPGVDGPAAVLAGSCADRTVEQLRQFETSRPVLWLDLRDSFGGEDCSTRALAWAEQRIADGPVAIATTAPPDMVTALQAAHGRAVVAERAEQILSALAIGLVQRCGLRRLIVAGGETAGAVLQALRIRRLQVGAYGGPGYSRVAARLPDNGDAIAMVLKSGKLGPPDMLLPALDRLRTSEVVVPSLDGWPPAPALQAQR